MGTTLSIEKNKEQLIKEVRERLDWYNFQASDEEFDENEVAALVELLKVLDTEAVAQVPDVDESFERFKQYLSFKSEDAERLAVLRGERAAAVGSGRNTKTAEMRRNKIAGGPERSKRRREEAGEGKNHRGFMRHAYRYAAAAVLAVVLVAGGTVGAVNAEKRGGVFQWLSRDDSGSVMLISPNDGMEVEYTTPDIFYNEEDVPEEYQAYLPDVGAMESLDGYALKEIEIQEMEQHTWILYKIDNKKEELILRIAIYHDFVVVRKNKFDNYEYIDSVILQDQEMELYSKSDDLGQMHYIVFFCMDRQQYYVQGKHSLEFLEQVALEYCDTLSK